MVAYTRLQQRKNEESERLREEENQMKFIDFRFERWQVVGFGKERRKKTFHKWRVIGMNDDFWDRVRRLGSET